MPSEDPREILTGAETTVERDPDYRGPGLGQESLRLLGTQTLQITARV